MPFFIFAFHLFIYYSSHTLSILLEQSYLIEGQVAFQDVLLLKLYTSTYQIATIIKTRSKELVTNRFNYPNQVKTTIIYQQ